MACRFMEIADKEPEVVLRSLKPAHTSKMRHGRRKEASA
jgi:hypothetical protein